MEKRYTLKTYKHLDTQETYMMDILRILRQTTSTSTLNTYHKHTADIQTDFRHTDILQIYYKQTYMDICKTYRHTEEIQIYRCYTIDILLP